MPDTMELQQRVERIENEVARWRWAALSLLTLLAITVLTGFRPQAADVVRAERFEVIGEDGSVKAFFGILGEQIPHMDRGRAQWTNRVWWMRSRIG